MDMFIIIFTILLVIFILLLIPVKFELNIRKKGGKIKAEIRIKILKIGFTRKIPTTRVMKPHKGREFSLNKLKIIYPHLRDSTTHLIKFSQRLWKSIDHKKLTIYLCLGFQESANTAKITGYLWSLSSILNTSPAIKITAEPDFSNKKLDAEISIKFTFKPIKPIIATLQLITKKPVIELLWNLRKTRLDGKG